MIARAWIALGVTFVVMAALLFGAAGTLRWAAAWVYLGIFFGASALIALMLARRDPGLLAERLKSPLQRTQPLWDKIWIVALEVAWAGWHALMGLDSVRFRWSVMPSWLAWIGGAGLLAALWIMYRTARENTFLAPVVRIQRERGQYVISTGPYAVVRHPYYAGSLILFVSTAFLLGSWYGLAAVAVMSGGLVFRIIMEERELRRSLDGYADYTRRVRYRVIPFVW